MSQIYTIYQEKLDKALESNEVYIQCPCCLESYYYPILIEEIEELSKKDVYCICQECGDSFYLTIED